MNHFTPEDHPRTEREQLDAEAALLRGAEWALTEDPDAFEALVLAHGARILTVTHPSESTEDPSEGFQAWRAACSLLSPREHLVVSALASDQDIIFVPPPSADELVHRLACIARAVSGGAWDVVEGYRPLPADEA
ncbi:hypothetical protein [Nocardiopsis lucentensis]|uniref:hypothetical protein n=1 Tax=Nocardiopsis lucentensis TaxID=53441 RepID=UPI000367F6F8|nr:hypothetical protein [Nocardiopsis lucentensis]